MIVNYSLASFPRRGYIEAMRLAASGQFIEPLLPDVQINHVQLCPQNLGQIDDEVISELHNTYPETRFRLHANARVMSSRLISDLSNFDRDARYWSELAKTSIKLKAPAYSAHAGRRVDGSIDDAINNARRAEQIFDCPVALEGHYPERGDPYLFSTWAEYRYLFESGIAYALDLSHLNIVSRNGRHYERELVREMLSSDRCIEVHLSGNDGRRDIHTPLVTEPVWWSDLDYIQANAVVFTEGQFRLKNDNSSY